MTHKLMKSVPEMNLRRCNHLQRTAIFGISLGWLLFTGSAALYILYILCTLTVCIQIIKSKLTFTVETLTGNSLKKGTPFLVQPCPLV